MQYQPPLALPPPAGAAHWAEHALLDQRLLAALAGVNRTFLALAVEAHAIQPGMPAFGLPAHVLQELAARGSGRLPVPALPFTLFDLKFRDARFWRCQAAGAAAIHDGPAGRTVEPALLQLARETLTLGWHLAQVDGGAARLALGLDPGTEAVLSELPVGSLEPLSRRVAPALAARFCTRERFWGMLAQGLPGGSAVWLRNVKLLGMQLQGMDAARARQLHRRARRNTHT